MKVAKTARLEERFETQGSELETLKAENERLATDNKSFFSAMG